MNITEGKVFLISFGVIAIIYAILASMTTLLYRNKDISELSKIERKILLGQASFKDRLKTFYLNILASLIFPPVYITAGIITFLVWLFT
ncbi:MAG: hypothetical protein ACOCUT_02650 [bacterium]